MRTAPSEKAGRKIHQRSDITEDPQEFVPHEIVATGLEFAMRCPS